MIKIEHIDDELNSKDITELVLERTCHTSIFTEDKQTDIILDQNSDSLSVVQWQIVNGKRVEASYKIDHFSI